MAVSNTFSRFQVFDGCRYQKQVGFVNIVKVIGEYFMIQQCTSLNITVGIKMTRCGHEPIYKNFTIGKDGFSLHPFQSCFWKDDTISLQGKAYRWIEKNGRKFFPRPIWRLCILLNVFRTSKTTKLNISAQYLTHLKGLNTSKRILSTK